MIAPTVRLQVEKSQSTPLLSFMEDDDTVGEEDTEAPLLTADPGWMLEAYNKPIKEFYDFRPLFRAFAFVALGVSVTCLEIVNHYSVDHSVPLPNTLTAGRITGCAAAIFFYVSMLAVPRI